MNKAEFLAQLRNALSFMSEDDRDLAVSYYEEYFADADAENEAGVIEDLSPVSRLVSELRAEYEAGRTVSSGRELAVPETGTQQEGEQTGPGRGAGSYRQRSENPHSSGKPYGYRPFGSRQAGESPFGSKGYIRYHGRESGNGSAGGGRGWSAGGKERAGSEYYRPVYEEKSGNKGLKVLAIILLALLVIPIGIPVIAVVFSVILFLVAALLTAGAGLLAGGVGMIVASVLSVAVWPDMFLAIGIGLILLSIGAPILFFGVWFCVRATRKVAGVIQKLYKKLTNKEVPNQ